MGFIKKNVSSGFVKYTFLNIPVFSLKHKEKYIKYKILFFNLKLKLTKRNRCSVLINSPYHKFNFSEIHSVEENSFCSGCGACVSICKKKAITLIENKDGFFSPVIDKEKCNDCGQCKKVCPVINFKYEYKPFYEIKCFAAQAPDEIRKNSSSGGLFPLFAEYILDHKGVVCGASYDETFFSVIHIIISDKKDLNKLKVSKYSQSNINSCLEKVEKYLKNNVKVLFVGTPCQVAGLLSYLSKGRRQVKEYKNLFTIDLVCGGVPSNLVSRKYLKEFSNEENPILERKDREKDNGWYSYATSIKTKKIKFRLLNSKNYFWQAFVRGMSTNKLCQVCPFDTFKRKGDITLGDFWFIGDYEKKLDDNKGTSLLLLNTLKGKFLLKEIKSNLKLLKRTPAKWTLKGNLNLIKPIYNNNRNYFFYLLSKGASLKDAYIQALQDKADCIIYNNAVSDINYGSLLTAYALQKIILDLGYYPKNIFCYRIPNDNYKKSMGYRFAREYLNFTNECISQDDFINLNNKSNIFIVGSDQMWRPMYWRPNIDREVFSYLSSDKNKFAVSVSLGLDKFDGTYEEKEIFRKELKAFKAISLREHNGVQVCDREFNCSATRIIDPVFVLDPIVYEKMAKKSDYDCQGKLVYYSWGDFDRDKEVLYQIAQKRDCSEVVNITLKDLSVEDWLNAIRTAKLVVSNSFHGICFSLIFNKQFICVVDKGEDRFDMLNRLFNIKEQMFSRLQDQRILSSNNIYNYSGYEQIVDHEKAIALNFIKDIF